MKLRCDAPFNFLLSIRQRNFSKHNNSQPEKELMQHLIIEVFLLAMRRLIFILFVFVGVSGFSQQPVFVNDGEGNLYSVGLNNCTFYLIGKTKIFGDIAFTPDGKLWGLNNGLYEIDTTNLSLTLIGTSIGTDGVALVALNDSTLLDEVNDSLFGINVRTAKSSNMGYIGSEASGDFSWLGNDLYMTSGYNQIIKIALNNSFTSVVSFEALNSINNPTPEFLGLATVSFNGLDSLIGFSYNNTAYKISPIDGSVQLLCSSLPEFINGAASISFPTSLPVTLLNFTSTLLNNTVKLQWQTTTEINSSYFLIERSNDGVNFSGIGKVNAAGNSNAIKQYSFIDKTPLADEAFYRLKEVDLDGNYKYSNILLVKMPQVQPLIIMGNPVLNNLQLTIDNLQSSTSYLSIFDFTGRRLKSLSAQNGVQDIDVSFLSSGTYVLQMITADGQMYDKVFVKGK
jgi:hypothetical protein